MDLEIILLIAILVFVVGIAHFLDKLQKKVDKIESRLNKDKQIYGNNNYPNRNLLLYRRYS